MFLKPRFESDELRIFRFLSIRSNLTRQELNHFTNLEKGFMGEKVFDTYLENISDNFLILNDLLFECNNSLFQIDSLVLSYDFLYPFEVKNYEGDYYLESDSLLTTSGIEVKNPLHQLKRSETLLNRLFKEHGYKASINPYLAFVNPEFYLYKAPLNQPIIFPTQLNRFVNNMKSQKLNDRHFKLAEQLVALHITDSPYKRLPKYTYEQLKRGITCASCHTLDTAINGDQLVCNQCSHMEDVTSAVLRSVEELKLLFPERKITTNGVYEWCKVVQSKKTIRRLLSKNFKPIGHGNSTYYD